MDHYKSLSKQIFSNGKYSLVPIRSEDKYRIMKWRNEQIYHLRQSKPLTRQDQDTYFREVVSQLFMQERPDQILFSYLENEECIGYGGLVHINWIDKNAEISFVLNTELEVDYFEFHWIKYLSILEQIAFEHLGFRKIYTYAYDMRQRLFTSLLIAEFKHEATLRNHRLFKGEYFDVLIHSKFNQREPILRQVEYTDASLLLRWANDEAVRNSSFNSERIEEKDHIKWFLNRINNLNVRIYILEISGIPIGQFRMELDNRSLRWVIDYSIDDLYRGKGLGKKLMECVLQKHPDKLLLAEVKNANIASKKVFESCGFKKISLNEERQSVIYHFG